MEEFVNQETHFVGHNWQPKVEQNRYYTQFIHFN